MDKNDKDPALDSIYAFAVWGNLDRVKDYELILLKGHLYLEMILTVVLNRMNVEEIDNLSFFKKMKELEKLGFSKQNNWKTIIASLNHLNKIRNKLAHDFMYKSTFEDLTIWSARINENLEGGKFSKYTKRTKIVHAFSTLSKNLLVLTD